MEIKTEKTHNIIMTDSELNLLRCFIEDAVEEGIWREWPSDQAIFRKLHDEAFKAVTGREIGE